MAGSPYRHLPRLADESYRGFQFVHWIMTIADRHKGWLNKGFHSRFREILIQSATKYHVVVPTCCLMPDHIHILSVGINPMADQKLWSRSVRRAVNQGLKPQRLQRQPYDHVLRAKEQKMDSFSTLVHYICNNPVRAGLVAEPHDWSYTGSVISELPNLKPYCREFHERWWCWWNRLQA